MNKLGLSLPWDYLSDTISRKESTVLKNNLGTTGELLKLLKDHGITSIELRHKPPTFSYDEMRKAINEVRRFDMDLTIHGAPLLIPPHFDIEKLFPWYDIVNEVYKKHENKIMITFHPIVQNSNTDFSAEQTVKSLLNLIKQETMPSIMFSLENQRSTGYPDPGITFGGITNMVTKVSSIKLGICWDMGHSYSNTLNYKHPLFPPKEFLSKVVHTHIHDLGPTGRTHWPVKENSVPIKENIQLLQSYKYKGVYNLELSFDRFADEPDIKGLLIYTINKLQMYVN